MPSRTIKSSVLLSSEEHAMLNRLAAEDGVPDTQVWRRLLRTAYVRRFGSEKPTVTEPTMRGLIADVVAPAHLFVRNVAERMGVGTEAVTSAAKKLKRKGLVELLEGPGADVTPEWMGPSRSLADALALAHERGIDVDEPLGGEE